MKVNLSKIEPYFSTAIILYLLSVALINPFSNYAVNDDWDFITHVRNFMEGDFVKNSLIDSSFILQGFLGALWSAVFGLSYPTLKILSVLVTILTLAGVKSTYNLYNPTGFHRFLGYLMVLFNPFVYPFSFTFMTEIYFLATVIWSVYFCLRYSFTGNPRYLLLGLCIGSLGMLIRQLGLLLVPSLFIFSLVNDKREWIKNWKYYLLGFIFFLATTAIAFLWPQYNSDNELPIDLVLESLKDPSILLRRADNLFYLIPYFGISISGIGLAVFLKLSLTKKILAIALSLILFRQFFVVNIFKLGNTLYPEGLMIKNNYVSHLTLYDNSVFKAVLTLILLLTLFSTILSAATDMRKHISREILGLFVIVLALTVPLAVQNNFYDRYLVNGLVVFSVAVSILYARSGIVPNKALIAQVVCTFVVALYVFSLSHDFHKYTSLQWASAEKLRSTREIGNGIFLSDSYSKYLSVYHKKNGPEITRAMPKGITYKCYIQRDFTINQNNKIYQILSDIQNSRFVTKHFPNPVVVGAKTSSGYRPVSKDPSKILAKQEYTSFLEAAVGNSTYVVTYCNDRDK